MRELKVELSEWNVMKQVCNKEENGDCGEEKRESYCKEEKECGIMNRWDERHKESCRKN